MQILGIYLHWIESKETPYLLAVSCSQEKLENMLQTLDKDKQYTYTIEPVKLYIFTKYKNEKISFNKAIFFNEDFIQDKIYGMNKHSLTLTRVDQVLLKILHDCEEDSVEYKTFVEEVRNRIMFQENNFSSNPIKFDKYYHESILNA